MSKIHLVKALCFKWVAAISLALALFTGISVVPPAGGRVWALDIEFSGRAVRRDILALYDSRYEKQIHETRIHKFAEMPLNHLGYRVVYHDVNGRLPDPSKLGNYRGVLTWFVEPLRRPETVVGWIDEAVGTGLKYVVLGEVAPPDPASLASLSNRLLARIGLHRTGDYVDLTWRARVVEQDKNLIGFERPVDKALPGFSVVETIGVDVQKHLVIESTVAGSKQLSTVVATSPAGGYASHDFTIFYEQATDRVLWTLNPFSFFRLAFGVERFPVPDATTLAGRRLYFSQIDGDGWNNISEIEQHREARRLSAEVVAREAIIPYPDLPVTVGLIAGDIDIELGGNPAGRNVARQLFGLPNVEVGSHTYSHPYSWQFFESYDRADEVAKVEEYQPPDLTMRERLRRSALALAKKELPADQYDKYVAGTDDLPRTYLKQPFDLKKEISGALKASADLAPFGKTAKLYMWSGDTTPFAGAIKATRDAGVRNINGGDARFDRDYPSVSYLPPLSRQVGGERQIYAANSNENTYTNDWTGPYYGYFLLKETLANTERPRRLKPFNLYYHMYSGEKEAALAAVKSFLEVARKSEVIPVAASRYAAIADDFFKTEIEQVDLFSWAINNRGAMQTVRFDASELLAVDLERSEGVLGSTRHEGALYVALDAAVDRVIVTLRARAPNDTEWSGEVTRPASLQSSRWDVSELKRDGCSFSFRAVGFGTGDMMWRVASERKYTVAAARAGEDVFSTVVQASRDGNIQFAIPSPTIEPVMVRVDCYE